jgi:endo-1,4-beta-xylanase
MYEDGIDGDFLKEVVAKAVKKIDIGTAVLPKPLLFNPDVDEIEDGDDDDDDDDDDDEDGNRRRVASAVVVEDAEDEDEDVDYEGPKDGLLKTSEATEATPISMYTPPQHPDYEVIINSNNNIPNTSKKITTTTRGGREAGAPDVYDVSPKIPTRYARTLRNEFNAVVVEHHLKWSPLCCENPVSTRLGRYDFHHADAIVDWAVKHNMKVKGHVLVWHVTSPSEILETMPPEQVREQLKRHIFTTMGHFRDRIKVWDVVNEALAPDGSLAETIFYRKLGPSYIEDCFRWAHEADPDAVLLYNDNKVEGMDGPNKQKADGFYHLLASLVKKGVPVHGCGIQAHFNAAGTGRNRPPTPRMVKSQIHRLGNLGLKVNISEMDVRVSQLPPNLRQIAQRQIYHDIVVAALTEPAFDGVWIWGFTDRHTWVTHFYYDDEPLLFDEEYGRKEAYYGLRDALSSITPGGTIGANVLLDTDEDESGNSWGHLWMQPELDGVPLSPRPSFSEHDNVTGGSRVDRPDWELT